MTKRYCFLCASDDGIFVDITANNREVFHVQFQICSVKVPTEEQLPTKICHKCVYELNQCSSFIQKCSLASQQKGHMRKNTCSLCREQAANNFIFNITTKKDSARNLYDELNKIGIQIKPYRNQKLICLSCRYTLDVLLDLKNVYQQTSAQLIDLTNDEEIDYQTFPKVKTIVVSRKTTVTESTRTNLYESEKSEENNLTDMTRTRSQDKLSNNKTTETAKPPKLCTKCKDPIKDGDDTFKAPRRNQVICKSCWNKDNVDTSKDKPAKAEQLAQQTVTETKQCTVYLKDVLKDAEVKDKVYKADKATEGKKTSVVADKDKESTTEQKLPSKASTDAVENTAKLGQKRSARFLKTESESSEDTPNKKHKPETKQVSEKQKSETKVSESETKPFESMTTRRLRRRTEGVRKPSQSADSDSFVSKTSNAKKSGEILTRQKRTTGFSLSDADVDNKRDRKKLRSILRGIPVMTNTDATSDDVSSNEEPSSKKRSKLSMVSPSTSDSEKPLERAILSRKSKAQEDAKPTPATVFKSQSSDTDTTDDLFKTKPYVCDDCGASYENKLMGLTHKLTHYKQPRVCLEKLSEESMRKEVAEPSEETDQTEEPSENIVIAMEDDEEEAAEEATKLSTNEEAEATSDAESKATSPTKEAQEDDVDVSLVMKESDDDQTQKNEEKEAEESRTDEDAEMSVPQDKEAEEEEEEKEEEKETEKKEKKEKKTKRSRRSRSIRKDTDKTDKSMRESTEDENANSEEKQDSLPAVTEEVQGEEEEGEKEKDVEEEKSKDKREDSDEDKAEEKEVAKEVASDEEKETEENSAKAAGAEKEKEEEKEAEEEEVEEVAEESAKKTIEEEVEEKEDESKEVDEKQTEEEEETEKQTEDSRKPSEEKEDEEESKEEEKVECVKEVANEEEEEEGEKKEAEEGEKKEEEEGETKEEEEEKKEGEEKEEEEKESKRKDSETEKVVELEEEEEEAEETEVICEKEAEEEEDIVEIVDKGNSPELKDTDDCTIVEDEADSSKKVEQNNVKEKESKDDEDVVECVREVTEQKSPKRTPKRRSVKKDEAESKRDSKEAAEVVEEIVLSEESSPLDKDDDVPNDSILSQSEASKLENSTNDSANAAAEVLQEVLALASAEVRKREETIDINMGSDSIEAETLENISRELQNTVDMPPLKMDDTKSENDICVK